MQGQWLRDDGAAHRLERGSERDEQRRRAREQPGSGAPRCAAPLARSTLAYTATNTVNTVTTAWDALTALAILEYTQP